MSTASGVSLASALAWRMRQQGLWPIGPWSVPDVVHRLGAVPAGSDLGAELAVGGRREGSRPGDVAEAVTGGRLIRTFAFRGATHLMTPEDAGTYLALRASSRMWELPSWQSTYSLTPADWPALREAVAEALGDGPRTRDELGRAVTSLPRFRHLDFPFTDPSWTLMKALAWQGELSLGPSRQGHATVQSLVSNPRWTGLPDVETAGPSALEAYVRAYGPTTTEHLRYWLGQGLGVSRKRIHAWVHGLGDRLVTVHVDGAPAFVLAEDLQELVESAPASRLRLLPGHDQWVLGPGTADTRVVPATRRAAVTRGANLVIIGGVVSGTWSVAADDLVVVFFDHPGAKSRAELDEEAERLATIVGRTLTPAVRQA